MSRDPHAAGPTVAQPVPDFAPDDRFVATVRSAAASHRSRVRRRAVSAFLSIAVVAGVGAWYVDRRVDRMSTIELRPGNAPAAPEIGTAPFTLLVLGMDGCPLGATEPGAAIHISECDGRPLDTQSADTILVARVDPASGSVGVLSIPRDLAVGDGRKINALTPSELRDHLRSRFGITIDRAVGVTFGGFRDLGTRFEVRLSIGTPVEDRLTGLSLGAGCQIVSGQQLLALVRARHLRYQDPSGRWLADPTGDLGRVTRQQSVLMSTFTQIAEQASALDLPALLDQAGTGIVVDRDTSLGDLVTIARLARHLHVDHMAVLPTHPLDGDPPGTWYQGATPGPEEDAALAVVGADHVPSTSEPGATSSQAPVTASVESPGAAPAPVGWHDIGSC